MTEEQPSTSALRAPVTQVLGDRSTRSHWQRDDVHTARLSLPDGEGTLLPVDVLNLQAGDLTRTEAHVDHASRHCVTASAAWVATVKRLQEPSHLVTRQTIRQSSKTPLGDCRNSRDKVIDPIAVLHRTEAEVTA
jgi:hypothetical protein